MINKTINNELRCKYPEHYHTMTADELEQFFSYRENRFGIRDEERHSVISLSWTKPGIINYLTNAASVLNGAEKCMKKNLQDYRKIESYSLTVASQKAHGLRFEYTVTGKTIVQCGELIVFRVNNKFYSAHYISKKELNSSNLPEFQSVLESLSLI